MRTLRGLIGACHVGPTLAVTVMTTALAWLLHRGWGCVAVALAVAAGQLSVGWSNDWLDAERDARAHRSTKPIVAGLVSAPQVAVAAVAAFLVAVPFSLLSGWRAAAVHMVAIASAWGYNARLKATWWSPAPYVLSFALLPAFVTLGSPAHEWPRPAVMVIAALLGCGVHFINTISDVEADAATGVIGLPQHLGPRWSCVGGACLLLGALVWLRALGGIHALFEDALVLAGIGATVMVVITAWIGRAAVAQRWAISVGGLALCLFAVAHPMIVGGA